MKTRAPAVAGQFYPDTIDEISIMLSNIIEKEEEYIDKSLSQKNIIGAVVPHAGYMFSAYQAVHFFEIIKNSQQKFDTFFIINPNHTGYSPEIALDENDYWETPFGKVELDMDYYDFFDFQKSEEAHRLEHSGEIMVPLLQYFLNYSFKITPVTISRQSPENAKKLADSIFKANTILKKNICIIASSDFSHFVSPEEGMKSDKYVIDEILKFNSQGVYDEVKNKNITVCGYAPIMTLIEYAKMSSAKPNAKILKRGHSGEVVPSTEVVDYVSILFYE